MASSNSKIRLIVLLAVGFLLAVSARPLMTYVMYLQENEKAKVNVEPPPADEIVGFDPATGGMAGFGSPSSSNEVSEDDSGDTPDEESEGAGSETANADGSETSDDQTDVPDQDPGNEAEDSKDDESGE